jgi:hypothetical protein
VSIIDTRIWRRDSSREEFVDAVVAATAPNDVIFDLKGESIFRKRAVYYVYEDVGRALTANGTIADRGPEEIVAGRCCATIRDSEHIPPRTRAFLNRHFIGAGFVRVCGLTVTGSQFDIAVPQTYVLARDPSRIAIDGVAYRGPRPLTAGQHSIALNGNERATVIWSRAAKEAK